MSTAIRTPLKEAREAFLCGGKPTVSPYCSLIAFLALECEEDEGRTRGWMDVSAYLGTETETIPKRCRMDETVVNSTHSDGQTAQKPTPKLGAQALQQIPRTSGRNRSCVFPIEPLLRLFRAFVASSPLKRRKQMAAIDTVTRSSRMPGE
ncbi:hypothetical protein PHSY_006194 [Pseudozyma hubeiensis SY62]|uniref:Uncharacterized protein n=1 Tax=Pseudozyma hubeiensis (strain SY62) TaxID=1305764 RepID=R9PKE4_PSEHS|nr:hypothetical protein PHSY_006194 [Pseudozyma hubeiensis SY62]GAC98600.1 hypothetical protein PHSY_006194 [Pseudozyma hubeiensis SY62]